jgi:FixJ family two-component response regulator
VARDLVSVVDDDESVRRSTSLLVQSFGYRAAVFASAEGFLRSERLRDTSCLILDVHMPDMNGLQLQSHLTAEGYGIPIIFITAYDDQECYRRAMQAGAVAFLRKPFSDEYLLQTMRSALRHDQGGTEIVTAEEHR